MRPPAALIIRASAPALGNDLEDPAINAALQWNDVAVTAVRNTSAAPTVAARALFIVHSAMYDAWAAYDPTAISSLPRARPRQPQSAATLLNKTTAVSYAAYRTLADLFPTQISAFNSKMVTLGFDACVTTTDPANAAGVGNAAAVAQIAFSPQRRFQPTRRSRGAPYSDYTGYQAVNFPESLVDPNRWQALRVANGTVQKFLSPHWGRVIPFAMKSADPFRPGPPAQAGTWLYQQRMRDVMRLNATLDDHAKMSAEYWDDSTGTHTPPGHWNRLAEAISNRDQHTLDQDVKMFFVLNASQLDVTIAVGEAKRTYDYIRPVSAVHNFYQGQMVQGWAGPGVGVASIDGSAWLPWIATPPHPEFPSDHSAFSNAAADILRRFTGSDTLVLQVILLAGSSRVDRGASPTSDTEADFRSRVIGRGIASLVWDKYTQFLNAPQ